MSVYRVERSAFTSEPFTRAELAAMRRHIQLVESLRRARYFAEEERSLRVTMGNGVMTSHEMTVPDAGATRDMLAVLRQIFSDRERGSFASMLSILRTHSNRDTPQGQRLLEVLESFDGMRRLVLRSWDLTGGQSSSTHPPLTVFRDWMYGEYLHSDPIKAERIEQLDSPWRLYEWQFHWIAERLASLYSRFAPVVASALDEAERMAPELN
jgi:hypothetical protein